LSQNISKSHAREVLALSPQEKLVVYVGRLYDWKGVGALINTCKLLPEVKCYFVGSTEEEYKLLFKTEIIPNNVHFVGDIQPNSVPTWLSAADVLVVLGTKQDKSTYLYRSPMKTYEYLAMRRPVVASSAPAISAIVSKGEVMFYKPDDSKDMVRAIQSVLCMSNEAQAAMVKRGVERVKQHTWEKRARRISALMKFNLE